MCFPIPAADRRMMSWLALDRYSSALEPVMAVLDRALEA